MPAVVSERPYRPVPTEPLRKLWARSECAALESAGFLDRKRLELVDGELIRKIPKNRPHANALAILYDWAIRVFGGRYINSETPIDVSPEDNPTSEPEPDIIILNRPT